MEFEAEWVDCDVVNVKMIKDRMQLSGRIMTGRLWSTNELLGGDQRQRRSITVPVSRSSFVVCSHSRCPMPQLSRCSSRPRCRCLWLPASIVLTDSRTRLITGFDEWMAPIAEQQRPWGLPDDWCGAFTYESEIRLFWDHDCWSDCLRSLVSQLRHGTSLCDVPSTTINVYLQPYGCVCPSLTSNNSSSGVR